MQALATISLMIKILINVIKRCLLIFLIIELAELRALEEQQQRKLKSPESSKLVTGKPVKIPSGLIGEGSAQKATLQELGLQTSDLQDVPERESISKYEKKATIPKDRRFLASKKLEDITTKNNALVGLIENRDKILQEKEY